MKRGLLISIIGALGCVLVSLCLWLDRTGVRYSASTGPNVEKVQSLEASIDEIPVEALLKPAPPKAGIQDLRETQLVEEEENKTVFTRAPAGYQPDQLKLRRPTEVMGAHAVKTAVDMVTGVTKANNSERFRAVADLYEAELPEVEAARLLDYLKDQERYVGMSDAAMYVLINEIVAIFHDRIQLSEEYLKASEHVIDNDLEHEVIRDYTLQGLSRGIGNASEEQAKMIRRVFWESLDETDNSLAGTALLALNRERKTGNLTDDEVIQLGGVVATFLDDPDLGERTRIPAIQVAKNMELSGFEEFLVKISSEPRTFSERIVINSIKVK